MRFVTGYGGGGVFEQDVTALAPLLTGRRTIRLFLSSYSELPGWTVSLELVYSTEGVGFRRPAFAMPLFNDQHVTGEIRGRIGRLKATVEIPQGLSLPRLRIISTGHATDGTGRNEFVTANHMLVSTPASWIACGSRCSRATPNIKPPVRLSNSCIRRWVSGARVTHHPPRNDANRMRTHCK